MAALAILLAALTGAEPAVGSVLSTQTAPTTVSAYAGVAVWSAPTNAGFQLVSSHDGGPPTPLAVAERSVPFDVDVGPGPAGGPVAVYSRCRREPSAALESFRRLTTGQLSYTLGVGCDIYRYDFGRRRERRVDSISIASRSEVLPTIWRDRIAFAAVSGRSRRGDLPKLYVRSAGERRSRRVRGGTDGFSGLGGDNVGPVGLDLYGKRLAFAWDVVGPDCRRADDNFKFDPVTYELWLGTTSGTARMVDRGCGTDTTTLLGPPAFSDGQLSFLRFVDDETGSPTRQVIVSRLRDGQLAPRLTDGCLFAVARDRGVLYTVRPADCSQGSGAEFEVARQPLEAMRRLSRR